MILYWPRSEKAGFTQEREGKKALKCEGDWRFFRSEAEKINKKAGFPDAVLTDHRAERGLFFCFLAFIFANFEAHNRVKKLALP